MEVRKYPPRIWSKGTFLFLFLQIFIQLISMAYDVDVICSYQVNSVYSQLSGYQSRYKVESLTI